jgi:hypothetical protein
LTHHPNSSRLAFSKRDVPSAQLEDSMSRFQAKLSALGVITWAMSWSAGARADDFWVLGVDGEYVYTLPSDDDLGDPNNDDILEDLDNESGAAFHGRVGYQLDLLLLFYLRPEIGAGAYFYGSDDDNTRRTEWRAYGGGRFGLRTGLSPGVYGHVGHGWYGKDHEDTGFTGDAGLLLDLAIIPHLTVGLQGGLVFNPDPVPMWFNGGAHLEVSF